MTTLTRTVGELERGVADGLHPGAQLYVSVAGTCVADIAVGEARPGVPMTTDSLPIWFSCTKTVTSVAAGRLWERGALDLDDPVAVHIPEFAANGKKAITIRHLLTHTAGIRYADGGPDGVHGRGGLGPAFMRDWDTALRNVCGARAEEGWEPGRRAGYHPFSGMLLLGEIVRRHDGRPFSRYVREEIFEPLGMADCWVGMPVERYRTYGEGIAFMHAMLDGRDPVHLRNVDSEASCAICIPGGNGRGPVRQFARLFESLIGCGVRVLSPQTVEAMTARHRVGMVDETFGAVIDWGLGFAIDSFNYGRHCSPRTYGHGGGQSSVIFGDPEHRLVVAVVTTGMPGNDRHYLRMDAVASTVYEELGLADPGSPGRSKSLPRSGLA